LELAKEALAHAGDIDAATRHAMLEEAKAIADAVVTEDLNAAAVASMTTITFSFTALNCKGEPVRSGGDSSLFVVKVNGREDRTLSDLGSGNYSIAHRVSSGNNTVDVSFNGVSVQGFPISFTCSGIDEAIATAKSKLDAERAAIIKEELDRMISEKKNGASCSSRDCNERSGGAQEGASSHFCKSS